MEIRLLLLIFLYEIFLLLAYYKYNRYEYINLFLEYAYFNFIIIAAINGAP